MWRVLGLSTSDSQHPGPAGLPRGAGYHTRVHPRVHILLNSGPTPETKLRYQMLCLSFTLNDGWKK